ncbi:hypothetical protein DS745_13255 [Anaerobacillus alkaliphilus]|uniref:Bacterial Pleckstrin homology domain-containing protein n=1 Tax=Anaerobacillus alkaliphilus TaxID=1548597 RepID=A0A4Q0VSV4_9BACI|nr:hypothetical protein [Anaerobacillus alkaliphilus]RXI99844.1 hypothetical protein DS745_13255 [Anaerobacillus alkaliphilus]
MKGSYLFDAPYPYIEVLEKQKGLITLSLVSKQSFVKVLREVIGIEQRYIETEYQLYLYETKIVTPTITFPLSSILDVSYRKTTEKYGTLYLHTNQGVFPYNVCSHPEEFITSLKRLKGID